MFVNCLRGVRRQKHETAFVDGFNYWNKARGSHDKGMHAIMSEHFESGSHKTALYDYAKFFNRKEHVDIMLDFNRRENLTNA